MNRTLRILTAVALTSASAVAIARANDQSTKEWLRPSQAPARGIITAPTMPCGLCKVESVTVKEAVATKPSQGTTTETVALHRCPRCAEKLVPTSQKQTESIHTCGGVRASCCGMS